MKLVLGLDLGTSSIGWALVREAENDDEKSSIVATGVRIVSLSPDELKNVEEGKAFSINAERTLARGMRRNLQRYKLRRASLIKHLTEYGWLSPDASLYEAGNSTTFQTYRLRAKAVTERISLEELSRVLLMLNKKRGYKSNRRARTADEGQLIDGMKVACQLRDNGLTPGQYVYNQFKQGKRCVPAFYRSDLQAEFDRIWAFQQQFRSDVFSSALKDEVQGKGGRAVAAIFRERHGIYAADSKEKDKRLQSYRRRAEAVAKQLSVEETLAALCDVATAIAAASGYLGAIGDRSKELKFSRQTVGQWLMAKLDENPNFSLRNTVFYRNDYLEEFESIWETQARFHPELTPARKHALRDMIIFYQRPLKSQKDLVAGCELERREVRKVDEDGSEKTIVVSPKVCPKSSPLFQEFKIWQRLNDLRIIDTETRETRELLKEERTRLYEELSLKEKLTKSQALKLLFGRPGKLSLNFDELEGNRTNAAFVDACRTIINLSGHGEYDFAKLKAADIRRTIEGALGGLGFKTSAFRFDPLLEGKAFYQQDAYRLWHLIYSSEDDKSDTGTAKLVGHIADLLHCGEEYASVFANIGFRPDYGSLSAKAIRKILPHMQDGKDYAKACLMAGYNHSQRSLTKEELASRTYKDRLDLLPRNSLRNPIVEKILNQMINVVNAVGEAHGKPDEIRIEMARELKMGAKDKEQRTKDIAAATKVNERIRKEVEAILGTPHVSRNDIIRFKLYKELKDNGYKTLYSNTYISEEDLFSDKIDIEHILPKARIFDDSFSNKTLEYKDVNIEKGNKTAYEFVLGKYGESAADEYRMRVDSLYKAKAISKSKHDKLLMRDVPDGFIERDLRNTQYIARKAREILEEMVPVVVPTIGSITDRLREDWQVVDVMKELNLPKYDALGLTEVLTGKDGRTIRRIKDWTKRNDHRHHAMDALVIAFTKPAYIQYLNHLNARADSSNKQHAAIKGIEAKELVRDGHNTLRFKAPFEGFRAEVKRRLQNILVSNKAKNKVVTENVNRIRTSQKGTISVKQLTPRGSLHNDTIYGSILRYEPKDERIGGSFDYATINRVANARYREALRRRLDAFDGDPKKAFTGKNALDKTPLYLNDRTTKVPARVKTIRLKQQFTKRVPITPDLKLEKVVDGRIKRILEQRVEEYDGSLTDAFSNLDENPIYQNKERGITIKRVTIMAVSNAIALHDKRDVSGKLILDAEGKRVPTDYVSPSNNHHVAIFCDADGNWQEHCVSFFETVERVGQGLPPVDKGYKHDEGWQFLFTMKRNEYFVFPNPDTGFNPAEVDLLDPNNAAEISPNLFRVQKLTSKDYYFRHHLETTINDNKNLKDIAWKRITSLNNLKGIVKVRINHIGQIVAIGEYD